MKKYITYTITAFFAMMAVSIAAPDKDTMMAKEKAAWQAFVDKKADDFKKLVSPSLMCVYPDGIANLQQEIDRMPTVSIQSFILTDLNLVMADPDTAVVTYKANVNGTSGGKDMSGNYNCGSIWQMKDGQWLAIFHSDMKAETPMEAQKKE